MNKIVESVTKKTLYENIGKNVCFSPSSLSDCLSILEKVISENIRSKYTEIKDIIISESDERLKKCSMVIFNQLWVDYFSKSVIEEIEKNFDCQFLSENILEECNKIVAEKTNGLIQNLLDESAFNKLTFLVGLNTIYFNAEWGVDLKKSPYSNFEFKGEFKHSIGCRKHLKYYEDEFVDICEIPFKNTDSKAYFLLPIKGGNFHIIERLGYYIEKCKKVSWTDVVNFKTPEFKIESEFDIKKSLSDIGYGDFFKFSEEWDIWSEQAKKSPFFASKVSQFSQKVYFEASEKGVLAAAATAFSFMASGCYFLPETQKVKEISLDMPFVFIVAKDLSNPEFIGLVNDV